MYTNNYNQDKTDKFLETQITKLVKEGERVYQKTNKRLNQLSKPPNKEKNTK